VHSDFRILGAVEVLQEGDPIDLGSPRQRVLLARLLINPGRVVTTDRLIEDLWSGDPPETARHALHVYVSRLRKALGPSCDKLESQAAGYLLNVEPDELDAARFERLAIEGRASRARRDPDTASAVLHEALGLWRGPALADVADEAFAREEAVRLEELRLATLVERIWADLDLGRHGALVEELHDLVVQHPFREAFWEQLMMALYRSNRQADALRSFQTARTTLAEELGLEPGPALRRMEQRILSQDPTLELDSGERAVSLLSYLPMQRTSFVGRVRELAQGTELLETSRLLTLTGPPGSGKTRLALRLAADHRLEYPHGSFFVPLAAVSDVRLVDSEIARALDLGQVVSESALDGLKAFLRDRRSLIVLDNFEQIAGAAPLIGELLDAAPGIKIVVTSRSSLGLSGEQEFPVPPLGIPPLDNLPDVEELAMYDAVALFVARSRASDPNFDLTSANATAVAGIAARLDGLPLAIELAAARIKMLPPLDLLSRLERRLRVLTGGAADTVDRHRTMRNAIAWSFDLLDPEERMLFRRLGVFVGGFTLEAATAVVDLPDIDIFDSVGSLLSGSLLQRPVDVGQARFAMLEMIREYALEALRLAGEEQEFAGRHASYFLRLAEEVEPQLARDPTGLAVQRLSLEVDNIRGALRFAVEADDPDLGLRLASNIWRFWQASDQLTEGRGWLDGLLEHSGGSAEARARGLTALAGLAYWQADYDEAFTRYSQALELYRSIGDRANEADTLYGMSLAANWRQDLDTGERLAAEARSVFEELGSREGVGRVLMAQAFSLWRRREFAAAQTLLEESLVIARETGDQALAVTEQVFLAGVTYHQGDRREALRIVLEGLEEAAHMQNVHVTVWFLDFVAAYAAPTAPEAAVRLAGAVDALRQEAGGGILPETIDIEDARSAAARALSNEGVEEAWLAGRRMSLAQALEEARELERLVPDPDVPGGMV